jgi:cytochrome c oxidase cbb3-type subunit 2
MKNGPLFFLGLFASLTLSFAGVVLLSNSQLGGLTPYFDEAEGKAFPDRMAGLAARGQLVYRDLGCASCHTQQVRRPGFGADQARGWGDRQSVARDFVFQANPQLGTIRIGPDLANLAGRKPSALDSEDLMKLLYLGQGAMPSHSFLFNRIKISGERPSRALKLTGKLSPAAGYAIVPSEQAQSLVSYLLSLNTVYDYPEARPVFQVEAKKEGAHK